jgi:hypothetical protein
LIDGQLDINCNNLLHSYIQTNPDSFSSLFEFKIMGKNSVEEGRQSDSPNPIDLPEEDSESARERQVQEADQITTMVLREKKSAFLGPPKTNDDTRLADSSNDAMANLNEDETRRLESTLSIPGAFCFYGTERRDQNNQADEEFTISSGSDDSSAIYVVPRAALVDEEQKNAMIAAPVVRFQDELPLAHASDGTKEKTVLVKNKWVICLALVCCLMIAGLVVGLTVAMMDRNNSSAGSSSVFLEPAPSRTSGNTLPAPNNDDSDDKKSSRTPAPSSHDYGGGEGSDDSGGGGSGGGGSDGSGNDGG